MKLEKGKTKFFSFFFFVCSVSILLFAYVLNVFCVLLLLQYK